jgi:hypothetical protein
MAAMVVVCAATESVWAGPGPCSCNADVSNLGGVGVNIIDVVTTADCARIGSCGGCVNSCDVDCDGDVDYYDAGVVSCAFQGQSNCCTEPDGACTGATNSTPPCVLTTDNYCDVFSGTYHGDNTICVGNNAVDVPAASTWGLAAMSLGTMIAGTILLRRGVRKTEW